MPINAIYSNILKIVLPVFLIFLNFNQARSQDTIRIDTSGIVTVNPVSVDTSLLKTSFHSPIRASLLSATLPGLGQVYNKKYWKVPVIYAAIGISYYFYHQNQVTYKKYLQGYVDYSNTEDYNYSFNGLEYLEGREGYYSNPLGVCKNIMDTYRRWRDMSIVFLAASYFLNIIDATVDGYLFDYDISDKLTLKVEPVQFPMASNYATGLKVSFNLH